MFAPRRGGGIRGPLELSTWVSWKLFPSLLPGLPAPPPHRAKFLKIWAPGVDCTLCVPFLATGASVEKSGARGPKPDGGGGCRGRLQATVSGGSLRAPGSTDVFFLARARHPGRRAGVCVFGFPRKGLRSGSGWARLAAGWARDPAPGLLC